jgi:hypothetical protein
VRAAQARLTDAQRRAVAYWSGGGVLRWNQLQRELVARFNLPPAPRDDGTYVAPDADNPFADPQFPFANPPYAARAYAYVSVAQYEALKAAWHWKLRYGRPAPARVDAGIAALAPVSELPAYPSEDAVLSGVTTEMLRLLFPAAVEEITRRAAEQREAALLSGRATPSDIAAGLAARPRRGGAGDRAGRRRRHARRGGDARRCGRRWPTRRERAARRPGSASSRRRAPRCSPASGACSRSCSAPRRSTRSARRRRRPRARRACARSSTRCGARCAG